MPELSKLAVPNTRNPKSCVGAFARRSMNRDLFVLTVLRNASRSVVLEIKGGDLSPNRTRQHPHETPPTPSSSPMGRNAMVYNC